MLSVTRETGVALQFERPEERSCPHRDVTTHGAGGALLGADLRWSGAAARVLLGEVLTTVDLGLAGEPSSAPGVSQVDSEST